MIRLVLVLAVATAALLFVSACAPLLTGGGSLETQTAGPSATAESGAVTGETMPEPALDVTVQPDAGHQNVVTLEDQGKTINLAVGESFLLNLGDGYFWGVEISDQNVVSRVMNIAVVGGAQGVYQAQQPGTVTLSAVGDPVCGQAKPPCGMPSILFTITIVVS